MNPGLRDLSLAALFLVLAVRLLSFVVAFGDESLQMDFSAFYTAGRAVDAGLSPYMNHIDRDPPIWDGIDSYRHSRFLYPPLVARLFQPLTWLHYRAAKFAWMAGSIVALVGALSISIRLAGVRREPWRLLAVGCVALAFHPLLTLLERGQNDSFTLCLMMTAVLWMARPRTAYFAGAILALATLLKLHCVFVVPFLVLRRQWRALAGFAVGGIVLTASGLALDGPAALGGYLSDELPRISRYGERGPREMRLPLESYVPLREMLSTGLTTMEGRQYRLESMTFSLNASIVRTPLGRGAWSSIRRVWPGFPPAQVSLVFLAAGLILLAVWQWRFGLPGGAAGELLYWQSVMVLILLCAPVSWVMGVVWLLPVAAVVAAGGLERRRRPGLLACGAGLALAAVPDAPGGWTFFPFGGSLPDYRYVVAELICLAGLLALWRVDSEREVS